uniref:Uncharacterized protein n=1 Tax=Saccharolobus islandicus TaxID=43080 RepID=Q5W2T9_SACIS|nr:hypothetical protein [Sulfolobus islandicus]CAG38207.1 hypothetical protein [Sulfolobus islandicus]
MSTLQASKNSPVHRGVNNKKDVLFLLESLDTKDREKIFERYVDYFKEKLSRTAVYQMSKGRKHLKTERILQLIEEDEEARKFVLDLLRKKAEKMMEIIQELEAEEE